MKITIVMGFFLPVPPAAGGATEKTWDGLAREFAAQGHTVTVLSRTWPGWPEDEILAGVRHRRLSGYAHTERLRRNLWRDLLWSWRIWRKLPPADVTIVNCVALPLWLGLWRRSAGRLVVMPGRMPKGQYRLYRRIDRVLAVSSPVREAVIAENPRLAPLTKIFGYPIDWSALAGPRDRPAGSMVTLGYIGRLHREKGLDLLVKAVTLLAARPDLPRWRLLLCGPGDVVRGGSGPAYVDEVSRALATVLPADRWSVRPPQFDPAALASTYREIDIFCYPSLAARGETFGVAVAEAMAAGAVPVVSQLPCFTDFVRAGVNGLTFDHRATDAPTQLAAALAGLIVDAPRRAALAAQARADTRDYDFPEFAARLLQDFSTLK